MDGAQTKATIDLLEGAWSYKDEHTDYADGTVLEFSKSSDPCKVAARFFLDGDPTDAALDCVVCKTSILIEERNADSSNRYEGVIFQELDNAETYISGTWTVTESGGDDGLTVGDSGQFTL